MDLSEYKVELAQYSVKYLYHMMNMVKYLKELV